MEYAQDEDIFFHLENTLYQLSLNFNTLVKKHITCNIKIFRGGHKWQQKKFFVICSINMVRILTGIWCRYHSQTVWEQGADTYYIFHLIYSKQNLEGFPKYEKFADIYAVKEFIEQKFVKNYIW